MEPIYFIKPGLERVGPGLGEWLGKSPHCWLSQGYVQVHLMGAGGSLKLQMVLAKKDSVQFSRSLMSDPLQPYGLQHARPPCPSPTPGVYSNSCPLSRWCHPATSSSVVPFSPCLQSFPVSGSFPTSQFFASASQSIGVSASASVLPMNIQAKKIKSHLIEGFEYHLTLWYLLEYIPKNVYGNQETAWKTKDQGKPQAVIVNLIGNLIVCCI